MVRRNDFASGFYWAAGAAGLALVLYLGWRLLGAIAAIATPFVAAFALCVLLDPVTDRIQTVGAPITRGKRLPAVAIVFVGLLLVLIGLMAFLVPTLVGQTGRLIQFFAPLTYRVEYAPVTGGPTVTVKEDVSGTSIVVPNLENGVSYTFQVSAVDGEGHRYALEPVTAAPAPVSEDPSEADGDVTPRGGTTDPATALRNRVPAPGKVLVETGDGRVRLTWRPPNQAQSGFDRLRNQMDTWLFDHQRFGPLKLPPNVAAIQAQFSDQLSGLLQQVSRRVADVVVGSVSTAFTIVLTFIVTFYALSDFDRLRARLIYLMPEKVRQEFLVTAGEIASVFGNYVRGMFLAATTYAIVAIVVFFGLGTLFQIGLQGYALLLGVVAGILYPVPFLGPLLTSVIAVAVSLATGASLVEAGAVLVAVQVQNFIFDNVVVPRVVGNSVGLHPLATVFALLLGGQLFGLLGMLLAVPVAGSVQAILIRLYPHLGAPTPAALLHPLSAPAGRNGSADKEEAETGASAPARS